MINKLKLLLTSIILLNIACTKKNCKLNPNLFFEDKKCEINCIEKYDLFEFFNAHITNENQDINQSYRVTLIPKDSIPVFTFKVNLPFGIYIDDFPYGFAGIATKCTLTNCNEFICEDKFVFNVLFNENSTLPIVDSNLELIQK